MDPQANEIRIAAPAAHDSDRALKEYCYYLMHGPLHLENPALARLISAVPTSGPGLAAAGLVSGLATYLPCSFKGHHLFGRRLAASLGGWQPIDLEGDHHLDRVHGSAEPDALVMRLRTVQDIEHVWASTFWAIRRLIGARSLDLSLVDAWNVVSRRPPANHPAAAFWPLTLTSLRDAEPQNAEVIRHTVGARGFNTDG